jgi:alpha-1,2-mannosyltransferase
MGATLEILRCGSLVTRERMRLVGFALLAAYTLAFAILAATSHSPNDSLGRPLGTDFSNVYAAGTYVREGRPQAPFDPVLQFAREQEIFGTATPFYGWHYPPFFLFVAALLAFMPYVPALVAWQGASIGLYLLAIRAILVAPAEPLGYGDGARPGPTIAAIDPLWLLLALSFPAVFVNLGHGHNGLLTAALFGAALVVLDRRPLLAGLLFGLLAYKPQFGVLIPVVLVATWRWRTVAAAVGTVSALAIVTTFAFGLSVWDAFIASTHFTRIVVLESGQTGWHKIQSVFAWVRMWGGSVPLAYVMQTAVTVALAAALIWLWRVRVDFSLKAAALIIAAILATPYSLDYDMTTLAPAIAFLAAHGLRYGFAPWEKSALAALWLAPLAARGITGTTLLPIGVPTMAAVLGLVLRRAATTGGLPRWWRSDNIR